MMIRQTASPPENLGENNSVERSMGDMPAYQHLHLDKNPNDIMIPGHFVREFREARGSVTAREKVYARFNQHLTENMEGEQRTLIGKFLHSKWARRIGLLGAGALAMAAGTVTAYGAPDWMGHAWNKVGEWGNSAFNSSEDALQSGLDAWHEMHPAAQLGVAAAIPTAAIGSALLVRRLRKGNKPAREERESDLRILRAEEEAIDNGYVRFDRKTS